jgi:hypothetical protein
MIKSKDQVGLDTTATDASTGCRMIFDPRFGSASGNVVLTTSARHAMRRLFELPCSASFLSCFGPPDGADNRSSCHRLQNFSRNYAAEEVPSMTCLEYDKTL